MMISMGLMQGLNPLEDPAALTAWTSVVSLLLLALAVYFAGRQVRVAVRAQREQSRPYVVIDLEPSSVSRVIVDFVVMNIGATPAREVQFEFEPEPKTTIDRDEYRFIETSLVADGIRMLPPRRRLTALFDQVPDRDRAGLPMQYTVKVTYSDGHTSYVERYVLDLNPLLGAMYVEERGLHQIGQSLDDIRRELRKWTNGIHGIDVFVTDRNRHDAAERARLEERKERVAQLEVSEEHHLEAEEETAP